VTEASARSAPGQATDRRLLAVVPVREGVLPAGGSEAMAECGGRALVVGDGAAAAAKALDGPVVEVRAWDTPGFAPGAWATALAPVLAAESVIVLPASPDGRDLAPRLAHALSRPLLAGAVRVTGDGADVARHGGLVIEDVRLSGPFVATLQPGVRGVASSGQEAPATVEVLTLDAPPGHDADVLELLPPDAATMDLTEAQRIVAGGAGLDGPARFEQLQRIADALGASVGGTRVVTDRHWLAHERQIGTTGVVVDPRLYLAFGISGAVQHTSGLGHPDHIVSVNLDPSSPMMQLADLALVTDANAMLDHLLTLLGADHG
jgi:electron transfer flavoprotein alpha subunit